MSGGMVYTDGARSVITRVAAADLSSYQYCPVYIDTDGKAALVGTAGAKVAGVLQNAPESGELAEVCVSGNTKLLVNAAIDESNKVMAGGSSASYRAVVATDAADYNFFAILLEASGAAGDLVEANVQFGVMQAS